MPRILRTVIPRIKKSLKERGIIATANRSVLLPIHLFREYKIAQPLVRDREPCEFDMACQVETEGDFGGWTYLSDLDINSPNWIYGNNYAAIEPQRFSFILSTLKINYESFVFIDFGSGKGRALLMASELPFKSIVGIEFSKELHLKAQENFLSYRSSTQKCKSLSSVCTDFVDFTLPHEPLILFFFDPCQETVFLRVLQNVERSLQSNLRTIYLVYVAPSAGKSALLSSMKLLTQVWLDEEHDFLVYKTNT